MRWKGAIKETGGVRFIRAVGGNYSSLTRSESSGEMEGSGRRENKGHRARLLTVNVYKIMICSMMGDKPTGEEGFKGQ